MQSAAELHREFREEVEAFLRDSDMTAASFGQKAIGDPNFVKDLRDGRACGPKVMDRVIAFMRKEREAA